MLGVTWVVVIVALVSMAAGDLVEVQVTLRQGTIRGRIHEDAQQRRFYSFKSIPFAKPPVGPLRFRDPLPAEGWAGVRDGTINSPKCAQYDLPRISGASKGSPALRGQEDCLYLDVYIPETIALESERKTWTWSWTPDTTSRIIKVDASDLPVMVYFHAGVFASGWAEMYEPGPLMRRNVVVVVVQYRLNTLGFLSTGDTAIPGNLGLKDQVMALHWVQSNIRDFGGDPEKVTLFGETQGAACVHFHILSPMSKGLFKRAILQSGTMLAPWALWLEPLQVAIKVGQILDCPGADAPEVDTEALANCLREKPVDELVFAQGAFIEWSYAPTVMKPTVDGEFLTDHPAVLLREGRYNHVDIMSGVTTNGGIISTTFMSRQPVLQPLVENFTTLGPVAFCYQSWEDDREDLARRTWAQYMGPLTSNMTAERFSRLTQLYSEILYKIGHMEACRHHVKDTAFGYKMYMYEFTHWGQYHFMDWILGQPFKTLDGRRNETYAGHSDPSLYLFNLPTVTLVSPEDLHVSRVMVDMWVNFADIGNPTPDKSLGFKWDPVTSSEFKQLVISTNPKMTPISNLEMVNELRNLPTLVNKLLYPERFQTEQEYHEELQLEQE